MGNLDQRKRRHDDKKKRCKKKKDMDHKRQHSCKRSRRNSDRDRECPDNRYTRARNVVRGLLTEAPELAEDLKEMLQMIDDGKVAIIEGINNRRIRKQLKELFPLLGLVKLKELKGAYAKPCEVEQDENESFTEVFQRLLGGESVKMVTKDELNTLQTLDADRNQSKITVQTPRKQIGPLLPPASSRPPRNVAQSDDDDVFVGPALPGMKGFRLAEEHIEVEMTCKAEQLEKEQWKRVCGRDKDDRIETSMNNSKVREAWMTMMPEISILKDSLGPQNQPFGKTAAFRSKEPAAVDKTWFDSPQERERVQRAKLDMELLGYVRKENAPSVVAVSSRMTLATKQSTVNESILPIANPKADDEMREQMKRLRDSRGPSLLEKHQRKQAEQAKRGVKDSQSAGGWNRDRDLTAHRGMSEDDAERMISAAKQINSKFTAPTVSRQFL